MIWFLLACTGSDSTPKTVAQEGTAAAQIQEDTGPPPLPDITASGAVPSLTPEEVAHRIGLAWSTPPDPGEVVSTYEALMRMGDSECPGNEFNITDQWLYGCTATTGYSYAGVSEWFSETVTDRGLFGELSGVAGDFWIDSVTGATLEGGGHSVVIRDTGLWVADIAGSWRWDEGTPWLADGFSGSLSIEFIDNFMIQLRGAANISGTHVAAQDLILSASCDYGPAGKLSLRDPGGGWYAMSFLSCDPCADVFFEGANLGEACVDFSGLVDAMKGRL
jgi:hypothetical protein